MKSFFEEFKKFISRGNVMDMAVGVVVGGAFTSIVNSLVNDIIMPLVGVLTSGVNFSNMGYELVPAVLDEAGEVSKAALVLSYGKFIQAVIVFLIVAFAVFSVVKAVNKLTEKPKEEPAPEEEKEPEIPEDILLLREIRDSLKK